MKSFTLEIHGTVTDHEGNVTVIKQDLIFSGSAPAIHNAIENMGKSFVHGLGVSLSRQMLGEKEEPAKKRQEDTLAKG